MSCRSSWTGFVRSGASANEEKGVGRALGVEQGVGSYGSYRLTNDDMAKIRGDWTGS
jgi:hypothetical protein